MHPWLLDARTRIAETVGDEAAAYDLSDADIEVLLDLAGVAAHDSGARTNAPLVSYLVGLAAGLHAEQTLSALAQAAHTTASELLP